MRSTNNTNPHESKQKFVLFVLFADPKGSILDMKISIPELSLVILIGASGSGKSTFARAHFKPTEILSSDFFRGLVSDDENDQNATIPAFEALHFVAAKRLALGKLTVIDATNVQKEAREMLVELAKQFHVFPVAIVLNVPEKLCVERNRARPDRQFGPHVIRNQMSDLRRSISHLRDEGFRYQFVLRSPQEIDAVTVERTPLYNNRKQEHGPFDMIGDVHGCFDELVALLEQLGYAVKSEGAEIRVEPPLGRKAIFVGDLVDRGPNVPSVLRLVMQMVKDGNALCLPGNHDLKLVRKLRGKDVRITHGLAETLAQLEKESEQFRAKVEKFLDDLVSHYVLDDGKLVVAHAGMKEEMQGRGSGRVRDFALYGETTGETDEFGLPIRYNWASEYRGAAIVVYGHTPVPEPEWLNRTINIDTGCVFGGRLTALRYPERELVSVPAAQTYSEPARPFLEPEDQAPKLTAQQAHDDLLDLDLVMGKRLIHTRLKQTVIIREENATAALEVMSRFAANPKWLIYLPPTMSPSETSAQLNLLEHPAEAFAYFRASGVPRVVCQEKHMGSRAVVIVCRDENVARARFGVTEESIGICLTRTGRKFFNDENLERAFLERVRAALTRTDFWNEFASDWFALDCELMPWSAKAQELLRLQYAAVGSSARASLRAVNEALTRARESGAAVENLAEQFEMREKMADAFVAAYRRYCWQVNSLDDLKLAPFHLLASEGATHFHRDHVWQMDTLARLCRADEKILLATEYKSVDVTDAASEQAGTEWWNELTARGGEGMVVKPLEFIARGSHGLAQPALKVRGREYLRIIYGPEYDAPNNLSRLRSRGVFAKRTLALREFVLGVEALERFVRREPLAQVHECVFGVLALESEPMDPRL